MQHNQSDKDIYLNDLLHFEYIRSHNVLSPRRARCGLIKIPPCENTLSTGADVAGEQNVYSSSGASDS